MVSCRMKTAKTNFTNPKYIISVFEGSIEDKVHKLHIMFND